MDRATNRKAKKPRRKAIMTKKKNSYRRRKKDKEKIVLGGKRVTRMITARDNDSCQTQPLMNKKISALSIASNEGLEETTQRKLPERNEK